MELKKPEGCTDVHLCYLDDLRELGVTNMYGAGPYLMEAFDFDKNQAREILAYWMKTFEERKKLK